MKKLSAFLCIVILAGCMAGNKPLVQTDVDRGAKKFPELSMEELQKGKDRYDLLCTQCHKKIKLRKYKEEEWKKVIPGMARMADKENKKSIDKESQDLIYKYVVTMGRRK